MCVRALVVSISISISSSSSSSREVSPVAVLLYISEAHYKQLLNSWHVLGQLPFNVRFLTF